MTIEELIHAWKNGEENETFVDAASPVGDELSDEELVEAAGGNKPGKGGCNFLNTFCFIDSCGIGRTNCAVTV